MMFEPGTDDSATILDIASANSATDPLNGVDKKDLPKPPHGLFSSKARDKLYEQFKSRILPNTKLDRTLVSNQANKTLPFYGWFKYKEGFSAPFVEYIIKHVLQYSEPGTLLDPFSGSGSALFAASQQGWKTKGIELLPVGMYATHARLIIDKIDGELFEEIVQSILKVNFAEFYDPAYKLMHIAITRGAFPPLEEQQLVGYVAYCNKHIENEYIRNLLLYAAFCILEEISYTRKDGQYLRWDVRSGRSQGEKPFNKGLISPFQRALQDKLTQIVSDIRQKIIQKSLFDEDTHIYSLGPPPELYEGSSLEILPRIEQSSIEAILTSPPYANRYDYTRTYALELVYLGCNDEQVKYLRQKMLSCTVENKSKQERLQIFYEGLGREIDFEIVEQVFRSQAALQEVLAALNTYQEQGILNNPGIATLVHNYFYEMSFVIYELARILRPGGTIVMVNDNVRYAGEEIPVDLILSDIAESFGLRVKHIWTLGRGKGNSSQQMGNHGRTELRKCVYIWEKDATVAKTRDNLLNEAHQINYRLRSKFFYRKIKEYNVLNFPSLVANLFPTEDLYNWDEHAKWGIGKDAFSYISKHRDLKPLQVFCHPKLLRISL